MFVVLALNSFALEFVLDLFLVKFYQLLFRTVVIHYGVVSESVTKSAVLAVTVVVSLGALGVELSLFSTVFFLDHFLIVFDKFS